MALREDAKTNLRIITSRADLLLDAQKKQVLDALAITANSLSGNYQPADAIADMTALYVNGIAALGILFGGIPAGLPLPRAEDK